MYNIEDKMFKLTTINQESIAKFNNLVSNCISDAIFEARLQNEDSTTIDLGYGTLIVSMTNNEVRYKFVPSAKLEEDIINAIKNNVNALDSVIIDRTTKTLLATYKDLN